MFSNALDATVGMGVVHSTRTFVRPAPEKARCPIVVTVPGMSTDSRLTQFRKTLSPIVVTVPGMATDVRLMKSLKALLPMPVTPSSMITAVMFPL